MIRRRKSRIAAQVDTLLREVGRVRMDNTDLRMLVKGLAKRALDAERELAAETERADQLGRYLSAEQYACHHLRRQLDAVQTVQGMSPAEHARVLSDAEKWRNHRCDQGEPYTVHEASLPLSNDAQSVTVPPSGRRGGDAPGADGVTPLPPSMAASPPAASAPADGGTVTP